jgi:hypothetical protein
MDVAKESGPESVQPSTMLKLKPNGIMPGARILLLSVHILWLLMATGCCQLMIPSHRVHPYSPAGMAMPVQDEMIAGDSICPPAMANPRGQNCCMPLCSAGEKPSPEEAEEPSNPMIRPPHSKFHPVPTRPVFAPLGFELPFTQILPRIEESAPEPVNDDPMELRQPASPEIPTPAPSTAAPAPLPEDVDAKELGSPAAEPDPGPEEAPGVSPDSEYEV